MNENYVRSDFRDYYDSNPDLQDEKFRSIKMKKTKILKILIGILSLLLVVEGLLYFLIIPASADSSVTFFGLKTLSAENLTRTLALYGGTAWLGFDTEKAATQIAANSSVESVLVEKYFPDRVVVTIKERDPVAMSLITADNKTLPFFIDKEGVLFSTNADFTTSSLPLISNLEFDTLSEDMRIHNKFNTLMEQILRIQKTNPVYFSAISEIRVVQKEYDNFELILYPIHSNTRVLTDRNLTEELLEYMMVIIDVISSIDTNVVEIDLRYGSVSYKMSS